MELDDKLCYCFHVTQRKIVNFIRRERPRRASQISECFGAGTGCGWCIPFLRRLHEQIVGDEAIEPDSISADEYEAMRKTYQRAVGRGEQERNRYRATDDPAASFGDFSIDDPDGESRADGPQLP